MGKRKAQFGVGLIFKCVFVFLRIEQLLYRTIPDPQPTPKWRSANAQAWTDRQRSCLRKTKFDTIDGAQTTAIHMLGKYKHQLVVYKCRYCPGYHLATKRNYLTNPAWSKYLG